MPLNPTMTGEQVIAAFIENCPSLEEAKKDLFLLRTPRVKKYPWYSPALSVFRKKNGERGSWYNDILPQLMVEVGWFAKLEDAEEFAKRVRKASKNAGIQIIAKGRLTMNKTEVVSAFREAFPSLEEAQKDILVLKCPNRKTCPWYNPSLKAFKKRNGKRG